eukprot:2703172-Heterocapsa_arctica.AAC.1
MRGPGAGHHKLPAPPTAQGAEAHRRVAAIAGMQGAAKITEADAASSSSTWPQGGASLRRPPPSPRRRGPTAASSSARSSS